MPIEPQKGLLDGTVSLGLRPLPETRSDMQKSNIAPSAPRQWNFLFAGVLALGMSLSSAGAAEQGNDIKLQENALDRYIVQKGDTLWGIAGKFLKDPWRWPQIWRMNQEQLKNPNKISPGNVIVLDRAATPARLVLGETVRLSPQIRTEDSVDSVIPAIPPRVIEPFLSQPLVIEAGGLDKAPRIVATEENRVHLGSGGIAYALGVGSDTKTTWQIYRPGKSLIDPETKKVLGTEAVYLGTGRVTRAGNPATIEIVSSKQEISNGDRLVAPGPVTINQYVPHAPSVFLKGNIIGMYDGLATSETGRDSVVAISRGKRDGVEEGHVLAVLRAGSNVPDRESTVSRDAAPTFSLPAERYGLLMIFRVFDAVSYALVMESTRPVAPGDIVQTP